MAWVNNLILSYGILVLIYHRDKEYRLKQCRRCKIDLPSEMFWENKTNKDGLQPYCKICQRAWRREWRAKYKEKYGEYDGKKYNQENGERFAQLKSARIAKLYEWLNELKQAPCTDCKQTFNPVCMDFDHLDGSAKIKGITKMVNETYSKERIIQEIEKCELVCANCHRLRTWASGREMPWYEKNRKYDRSTWEGW